LELLLNIIAKQYPSTQLGGLQEGNRGCHVTAPIRGCAKLRLKTLMTRLFASCTAAKSEPTTPQPLHHNMPRRIIAQYISNTIELNATHVHNGITEM
jgi:hypothetical protein